MAEIDGGGTAEKSCFFGDEQKEIYEQMRRLPNPAATITLMAGESWKLEPTWLL